MLWQRIISALVGIPLIIWVSYIGGSLFIAGIGIIILLGLYEYGNMVKNQGYEIPKIALYLSGLLIILGAGVPEIADSRIIFIIIVVHIFSIVLGKASYEQIAFSFVGIFFFAWTLAHLMLIRETFPQGFYYIFLCFIITWSTDTGAYFFGRLFGRHKLSPTISPNKTVEGALGGILFCVLIVVVLKGYFVNIPFYILLTLTVSASVLGQVGDLLESAVKRWAGVKDSGKLIPGHGGILDRFDSLTLVAPLLYYFLKPFLVG